MTNHPITPPPELVKQWMYVNDIDIAPLHLAQALATKAARWGADQELEACVEWLADDHTPVLGQRLRAARRPKPPTDEDLTLTYALAVAAAVDGMTKPWPADLCERAQLAGLRAVLARWGTQQ